MTKQQCMYEAYGWRWGLSTSKRQPRRDTLENMSKFLRASSQHSQLSATADDSFDSPSDIQA